MENGAFRNYKKYTLALLIITVAALIVCAASFALKRDAIAAQGSPEQTYTSYYSPKPTASQENGNGRNPSQKEAGSSSALKSPSPRPNAEQEGYLITVYKGKIGVLRDGGGSPVITADIEVSQLPEEDRKILEKGIPAGSLSEAKRILEDYE